jgi:outer membrane protein TolC
MSRCQIRRSIYPSAVGAFTLLLVSLPSAGRSEDAAPAVLPQATGSTPLTLRSCRQTALENQPAIAAAQGTLKAAVDRLNALENLRVPTLLARDLPIRRKQAALGVAIAQAGVTQAESETFHAVTSSYLGALYAAQQLRLVHDPENGILRRIKDLQSLVTDEKIRSQRRDVTLPQHEELVKSFLQTLDGRIQEAEQGKLRALAALREGMGVGVETAIVMPERELPCPRIQPRLPELIAMAQSRRGEMIQAAIFADVVCLEIDAQGTTCRPSVKTFASGSDIHAKPIPAGEAGGVKFRPVMVGPEMPTFLNGSRDARVRQARDYYERAQALTTKTRNLMALEAEDLYRRWLEKSRKATHLEKAYQQSRIFSDKLKETYVGSRKGDYPNLDEVIHAGLITTRLQLEWKEAHYESLLALAALERATAGGFYVDFDLDAPCEPNENEANGGDNAQSRTK